MQLIEFGDYEHRNVHCWNSIVEAIEQWAPRGAGGTLEAHFEEETLRFVFREPGQTPRETTMDISWIAYADQAERLGILAKMALVDIELERIGAKKSASPN